MKSNKEVSTMNKINISNAPAYTSPNSMTLICTEWNSQENRTPNMPGYATCACADSHRLRLTSGGR